MRFFKNLLFTDAGNSVHVPTQKILLDDEKTDISTETLFLNEEMIVETLFDKERFFASLRMSLFRKGFKPAQTAGIEAILTSMNGLPISWVAYTLATAFHKTNKTMKPAAASMNYSVQVLINTYGRNRISIEDANKLGRQPGEGPLPIARQRAIANILYGGDWGKTNLGNTEPNDGWQFRSRGMGLCQGRRNYRTTGKDIGLDLVAKPDLLLVLENTVKALHLGMANGRYVSGHNFERYLPISGVATRQQFRDARNIINGDEKADLIAGYALDFQAALVDAGYNK